MKKSFIAASLLMITSAGAFAAPTHLTIDSTHTFPSFEVKHNGLSLQRGRFNETAGHINLDTEKQSGDIQVTINAASIDTGNEALEKHLRGPDFFDTENYPIITFKGKLDPFFNGQPVSASGTLTIKNVSKPVKLNFSSFAKGVNPFTKQITYGVEAHTTIDRSEFGIKYGIPMVADQVKLLINVEAVAK